MVELVTVEACRWGFSQFRAQEADKLAPNRMWLQFTKACLQNLHHPTTGPEVPQPPTSVPGAGNQVLKHMTLRRTFQTENIALLNFLKVCQPSFLEIWSNN